MLFLAVFALTDRPEALAQIDAQYGVGPAAERFIRQNVPTEIWRISAAAGPLAQIATTRRITLLFRF